MPNRAFPTLLICLLFTQNSVAQKKPLRDIIDQRIADAWRTEKIQPPKIADDAIFLRRVYLDLCGIVPTYKESVAFLSDTAPDKRAKLIDRLLEDKRYAVHQADVWDMILFGRNPPGFHARDRDGFQKWIQTQFAKNVPYDQWVKALLKAEGNTIDQGAPMYLVQYDRKPLDATVAISQTFLGVQLQCARCHDHPFDDWKQTDFYGMAGFLARLQLVKVGKKGKLSKFALGEKNLGDVMFTGPAADDVPGKKGKPIQPRFLQGEMLKEPALPKGVKDPRRFPDGKIPPRPHFSRKEKLAEWVTSSKNPWFAKAAANRIWSQFMGRGLIHPVDNLKGGEATHPELLDSVTQTLLSSKFDVKVLIREICNSRAYQITHLGEVEEAAPQFYDRARTRPLSAEELLESWLVVTRFRDAKRRARRNEDPRFPGVTWSYMLRFFGKPNNGVGDFQGGLQEHLYFNNGQIGQLILTTKGSLHDALLSSTKSWDDRVDQLYLSVLNRYPTEKEKVKFADHLSAKDNPSARLKEAIWTLMICSEFRFNH